MCGQNAVFICTPFNTEKDFQRLETAISNIKTIPPIQKNIFFELPEIKLSPREAILSETEIISVENSLGKISAESACPCPPGIPVIMPGEVINKNTVSQLLEYKFKYITVVK